MKPRRFVAASVAAALLLITLAPAPVSLGAPQSESVYAANRIPDNGVAIAYRLGVDAPNRSLYRVDIDITGIAGNTGIVESGQSKAD
jgi:hypothetical protein